MLQYKRVGITVKSGLDDKNKTVDHIIKILQKEGAEVLFDPDRAEDLPCTKDLPCYECEEDIDLMVVIGGDGTILRTVRELKSLDVPILSVNKGTVGFLAETEYDEAPELIPRLLKGEGIVEQRTIIEVKALRGEEVLHEGVALNEVVIAQGSIARLVNLRTSINNEPLTKYHADGLIIATPTGSTAYSLAAGGPIVHPGLAATIVTPINPHSFSQKPIVLRGDSPIEVEIILKETKFDKAQVILTLDGQTSVALANKDIVQAQMSNKTLKFLRREEDTFFATIRDKLKWGERLEE